MPASHNKTFKLSFLSYNYLFDNDEDDNNNNDNNNNNNNNNNNKFNRRAK